MEEDIKVLENMRDNIYGAIQFEDDYQVRKTEQKEFDALNLAINHLRKTKLVHSQFIPKSKLKEIIYPTPENYIPFEVQSSEMYKKIKKLVEGE